MDYYIINPFTTGKTKREYNAKRKKIRKTDFNIIVIYLIDK